MGRSMKIIIVGGGIAGLAAAISLRKDGRQITVLEQSSLNREIGATISLQPNASKIVHQRWNLDSLLRSKGAMVDEGFQIYNLAGDLQISVPLSTAKYGADRVIYHRIDLHEALKSRAISPSYPGSPALIRTACRVTACDCASGTVTLADSTTLTADLVIGADGIKSSIRTFVLGHDVSARRTGHSAYRMVIPTSSLLTQASDFTSVVDSTKPLTTMVVGHSKRLIMGPARSSSLYSIVAMVPDESLSEGDASSSWTTPGDLDKMLETFNDFPPWAVQPLRLATEAGLWQLRDLDPLPTWYKGRAILIGDAAHAMLPTQGQGASQSIEDAEALGALFADLEASAHLHANDKIPAQTIERTNALVFQCRYDRVTTIQAYSRQTARPATETEGSVDVKMNPAEFMDYNCYYNGAIDWLERMRRVEEKKTGQIDKEIANENGKERWEEASSVEGIEAGMRAVAVQ